METLPAYITSFFAILLLTAFVKILTTLSILRYGIGLHGASFGLVIIGLSFALSLLVMNPQFKRVGGLQAVLSGKEFTEPKKLEKYFEPFLSKHAHPDVTEKMEALAKKLEPETSKASAPFDAKLTKQYSTFSVLIASFLVSELKEAFHLGFIVLIPFLVLDLLVTNVLLALGVAQISQAVVAFPLKILLFFAVDGWGLISEKLISSYV